MHNKIVIRIILWLVMISMPIVLIAGILTADRNTRKVGFEDRKPIIYLSREDGSYNVGIMDKEFRINNTVAETAQYIYNNSAPWFVKNLTALKNIIEMTVDRFLQGAFQQDPRS